VLREPQVKISKHLLYLKKHGLVESKQHQNWRVYALPKSQSYGLNRHLQCLQECIQENQLFRDDIKRLRTVTAEVSKIVSQCCEPKATKRKQKAPCCP
jgi:ArsR family transcriptional regulator